jgi:hypothetical protein
MSHRLNFGTDPRVKYSPSGLKKISPHGSGPSADLCLHSCVVAHRGSDIPTSRRSVPVLIYFKTSILPVSSIEFRPYNLYPTCDLTLFSPTRDS